MVKGMIDVLPDESFLSYCKGNSTSIYDSSSTMTADFKDEKIEDALAGLQEVLMYGAGVTFNCFYSVRDPTALSS